jgi:hypothetical protein
MANLIHPERFRFDVDKIAEGFYTRFLGVALGRESRRRFIAHPALLDGPRRQREELRPGCLSSV